MNVLVPVDGSDCSFRALEFGIGFAERYDAELKVIHITDHSSETTERVVGRAEDFLEDEGVDEDVDVYFDVRKFRRFSRIGKDILELAEEMDIDHIVMGHHGTGVVGRAIIGSAARTVVKAAERPVTVIP